MAEQFLNDTDMNIRNTIVKISQDKFSAAISLCPPSDGLNYTVSDVVKILNNNGVKNGIDEAIIKDIVEKERYYELIQVAKGRQAENGKDGWYKYNFRTKTSNVPQVLEDGSVDYRNMDLFESVKTGQVVAEYNPATGGICGFTVTGEARLAKKGRDLPPLRGKGFTVSEDKKQYISLMNGKIELDNGKMDITNVFTVTGDMDIAVGNVRFDGDVYVSGNVTSGLSIISTGNVIIDGHVGSVTIRSNKDVVLKSGMQGGGAGYVECSGNVSGKFFEAVTIRAKGEVNANYFFNCDIEAGSSVEVSGSKGLIIGGQVRALESITAYGLGNMAEIPTVVSVGISTTEMEHYNDINRTLAKVESDIRTLRKNQAMFESAFETGNKASKIDRVLYQKICQALEIKTEERKRCMTDKNDLMLVMANMGRSSITVTNRVCPGVRVMIDSEVLVVTDVLKNVQFVRKDNEIVPLRRFD